MSAEHDMTAAKPYDEMHAADGSVRAHYQPYADWLEQTSRECIARKRQEAYMAFHRLGITFNVYGEEGGKERLIPFDLLPRMRRLFNRVRLEKEEVAILRGMLTTFETPKRRG